MRSVALAAVAAVFALTSTPADARRYKPTPTDQTGWSEESAHSPANFWESSDEKPTRRARTQRRHRDREESGNGEGSLSGSHHSGLGGRPSAWCGWYMRTRHGGGPEYNLAANWAHRGSPSGPHVGAIVVWSHHVGEITGQAANGKWIVLSGNDSHRVRERARSVSGAVFRSI